MSFWEDMLPLAHSCSHFKLMSLAPFVLSCHLFSINTFDTMLYDLVLIVSSMRAYFNVYALLTVIPPTKSDN